MGKIVQLTVPIGNIEDITIRVERALKDGEVFFAEDTRVFKSLCNHLGIGLENKKVMSFHDHTSREKLENLLNDFQDKTIYLTSDAGSPYISDPAYELIQYALEKNFEIDSYSGVSSVINALELSGLAPIPFHFHGFLARDTSKKNQFYRDVSSQFGTHLFFEGASRVEKTLQELSEKFPGNEIVVARELTKKFQQVERFKGHEFKKVKENIIFKGEFVILLSIHEKAQSTLDSSIIEMANELIEGGVHIKKLSKLLSKITGQKTKEVYQKLS
jgi:16S rRNA (cytidine1402-2'-O)-methyltransferase